MGDSHVVLLLLHLGVKFIVEIELIPVVLRPVEGLVEVVSPQALYKAMRTVEYCVEFQAVLETWVLESSLSMSLLL